ncbi:hypothetical protein DL98DRAFT_441553 [Cadophora sp. DSE1049]|nr:hypothetical protein DL98DRAFT_441553 [Cadophora sp. DSE1049]
MDETIDIFEEKHPNKVVVFIFNQLSTHASKGSGALNAFTMNLGEGGAPLPQKVSFSYTFPFRKYLLTLQNTYFPPNISESKRARGLVGTLQELNYKIEKVIKVNIPNKKKRVKKTIIEEIPKRIKQILVERGCLPIGK